MTIYGLVAARKGSKGLKDKNILPLNGKPLIYYSIKASIESTLIDRTIFSSDSEHYCKLASSFGAEVPFLRCSSAAGDNARDGHVYQDMIKQMNLTQEDIIVHLRPTNPARTSGLIDKILRLMLDEAYDAVRTLSRSRFSPYKMVIKDDKWIDDLIAQPEKFLGTDMPRQLLPATYELNGNVDAFRVNNIAKYGSAYPRTTFGYLEDFVTVDIDTVEDFQSAESIVKS